MAIRKKGNSQIRLQMEITYKCQSDLIRTPVQTYFQLAVKNQSTLYE